MVRKYIQKLDFINGGPKIQYEIPFLDINIETYPLRGGYTISNPCCEYELTSDENGVTFCNPNYTYIQDNLSSDLSSELFTQMRDIMVEQIREEIRNILGRENI